jgi:hypothetical protein
MISAIYTVTALNTAADTRCWGWYPTKEEAVAAISGEGADLFFESNTYTHAVIEKVPPGIMAGILPEAEAWWFKAEEDPDGNYTITALDEAPEWAKGVLCFGMG